MQKYMTKISVVTAITGKKDTLKLQPNYKNVEYVAFLDEAITDLQWQIRQACTKFASPVMNAKIHKILTHKYVDSPYIVWMDGSMVLKQDPHRLVELMKDKDFAFFKHHSRGDLYKEIKACIQVKRGNPRELIEQKEDYLKRGIPARLGMSECAAFIRRNIPNANIVFEKWWAEICRYSERDQVSWPVAFQGQLWETIPGNIIEENDFFEYVGHIKSSRT